MVHILGTALAVLKAALIASPGTAERAALVAALQAHCVQKFNAGLVLTSKKHLLGPGGKLVECVSPRRVRASSLWSGSSFADGKVKAAAELLLSMGFVGMVHIHRNPVVAMVKFLLKLVALHGEPGVAGSYYYFTRPGPLADAADMVRLSTAVAADGEYAEYSHFGSAAPPARAGAAATSLPFRAPNTSPARPADPTMPTFSMEIDEVSNNEAALRNVHQLEQLVNLRRLQLEPAIDFTERTLGFYTRLEVRCVALAEWFADALQAATTADDKCLAGPFGLALRARNGGILGGLGQNRTPIGSGLAYDFGEFFDLHDVKIRQRADDTHSGTQQALSYPTPRTNPTAPTP